MSATVFRVQSADLGGRLDPFYYLPKFVEAESAIVARGARTLGKIVRTMSSGATPHLSRCEEHYADAENGVPLLRVQNITEEGVNNRDLVFIRREVHESDLRRSRVLGGDLLVTITGRVGSAAVAPEGFEGNINQHSVVVKTGSRRTSEYLAAFFNSRVGRALTLRRATGGTRPALDYSALRGVPIAEGLPIVEVMRKARAKRAAKESEAAQVLGEVDDYLLGELGIEAPPEDNRGVPLVFTRRLHEMSGQRMDPAYYRDDFVVLYESVRAAKYSPRALGDLIASISYGASVGGDYVEDGIPLIRISDLRPSEIRLNKMVFLPESAREALGNCFARRGDFLISRSGTLGITAMVNDEHDGFAFGSFMIRFRLSGGASVDGEYLCHFLNTSCARKMVRRQRIGSVQGNITISGIKSLLIPVPPLKKQREIAVRIGKIRAHAKRLRAEAAAVLEAAHDEVERIILAG